MKILVAPDKFKGSLSAAEAAHAISRGWLSADPSAVLDLAPIADGGEGFAETLETALNGTWVHTTVQDPLGRPVDARYLWISDRSTAVLAMSEASGLWRLHPEERSAMDAHTFGTGELLRHATAHGARTILLGLGGSATTDGGVGMAQALGFRFLDASGAPLPPAPRHLAGLASIQPPSTGPSPEIIAACDVENPLLGPRGTAHVFSPQKGASPYEVAGLEQAMAQLAAIAARDLGSDFRDIPGAGAAGGIGFGLLTFCRARIRSGFTVVSEALGLEDRIAAASLVITGEGRLDDQTLDGKGPAGVAHLARRHGKPVLAFAGSIAPAAESLFNLTCPIVDRPVPIAEAMERGAEFLERAAHRTAKSFLLAKSL